VGWLEIKPQIITLCYGKHNPYIRTDGLRTTFERQTSL